MSMSASICVALTGCQVFNNLFRKSDNSIVKFVKIRIHHRDTENTEIREKMNSIALCPLCLCGEMY